jgi:hypothetical protein
MLLSVTFVLLQSFKPILHFDISTAPDRGTPELTMFPDRDHRIFNTIPHMKRSLNHFIFAVTIICGDSLAATAQYTSARGETIPTTTTLYYDKPPARRCPRGRCM